MTLRSRKAICLTALAAWIECLNVGSTTPRRPRRPPVRAQPPARVFTSWAGFPIHGETNLGHTAPNRTGRSGPQSSAIARCPRQSGLVIQFHSRPVRPKTLPLCTATKCGVVIALTDGHPSGGYPTSKRAPHPLRWLRSASRGRRLRKYIIPVIRPRKSTDQPSSLQGRHARKNRAPARNDCGLARERSLQIRRARRV